MDGNLHRARPLDNGSRESQTASRPASACLRGSCGEPGAIMRLPFRFCPAAIPVAFLLVIFIVLSAPTAGRPQSSAGQNPPARRPEVGLPGSRRPTTKPGSHESSAKDERDRIAGKFPAPKEKKGEGGDQGRPGATVYVDVTVLDPERQALTLAREDFRVTIDGQPRKIVSAHYVFRGPRALDAGHAMPLGKGVVARADESRTIVLAVDEASFPGGQERQWLPGIQHALDVAGPADRGHQGAALRRQRFGTRSAIFMRLDSTLFCVRRVRTPGMSVLHE